MQKIEKPNIVENPDAQIDMSVPPDVVRWMNRVDENIRSGGTIKLVPAGEIGVAMTKSQVIGIEIALHNNSVMSPYYHDCSLAQQRIKAAFAAMEGKP